ncbi:hypothetical protein [Streptomyces bambusae]|nr:hypothetical protein [Streptomyces bambusae]
MTVGAGYGPPRAGGAGRGEAYGTFSQAPTRPELERFFFLDDDDVT